MPSENQGSELTWRDVLDALWSLPKEDLDRPIAGVLSLDVVSSDPVAERLLGKMVAKEDSRDRFKSWDLGVRREHSEKRPAR